MLSYMLAEEGDYTITEEVEEEFSEETVEQVTNRKNLLLKNIPQGTHIDHVDLHIDKVAELSASRIDYDIVSKPGNLYLLVFKSPIGKYIAMYRYYYLTIIALNIETSF